MSNIVSVESGVAKVMILTMSKFLILISLYKLLAPVTLTTNGSYFTERNDSFDNWKRLSSKHVTKGNTGI
jgi:hypothetical protein